MVNEINASNQECFKFLGFVDDCATGTTIEGYPILGNCDWLKNLSEKPYLVCAIGNPATRFALANDFKKHGFPFAKLISPSVQMSKYISIGEGSIICSNCVLTTNIKIGRHVILNLSCTVGHDAILNDFVSSMPGVMIAGNANIGKGVYLGIGSNIINDVKIGEWTIIGGGSTVVRDIPDHVVAIGTPAKPIKEHYPEI